MNTPDIVSLAAQQLNEHRATLLSQLARIDEAIAALSKGPTPPVTGPEPPGGLSPAVPGAPGRFAGMGLSPAVKGLLAEREKVTVPEAVQALKDGGFQTTSKHLGANVGTTLRRLVEQGEAEKMEGGAYRKATK